ncbi:GNAT family N-acetyltransferase [Arthrobacter alpinus]|uniref:GNAT family N-acetyltransferase n=1 Tax=Arthrobacter alpinus TaxID=656366 RepID=UPI000AE5DBF2|nr:GNAT family N-acetyltransferase [Arthrobacter alpinus]
MAEPLSGGNMNSVERDGNTVLRTAGSWTPTVHRYLQYLDRAGIDWIPRPVAIEGGRERLSFVAGEVPLYPLPDWVWHESVLIDGARSLRQLHDASVGFGMDGAMWQSPAKIPAEVICHNDFAPHNLVFHGGRMTGAIDFDMCSPGPRLWDLAYFATRAVPLTRDTPSNAPGTDQARARVQLILDAYGSEASWEDVLRVAIIRLWDLADFSRKKAAELGKPALNDDAEMYERDAHYLSQNAEEKILCATPADTDSTQHVNTRKTFPHTFAGDIACGDIEYSDGGQVDTAKLTALYASVGWSSYAQSPEMLVAAVAGSSKLVSAWSGDQLVGLARVISDGASIWYLQDLLVRPDFQRQGIGRALVLNALEGYGGVRQKMLLTDDEPGQKAFYETLGFEETAAHGGGTLRSFVRFD